MAGPDTSQGSAITAVPHTTHPINSSQRVTHVVDAAGRTRDKGYNANFDTTSSKLGTDTAATAGYTANSGESLTKTTAPTGSTESLTYANSSGPAQYLPTGGTDASGNGSVYHYTGAGNQDSSTDALAATASVSYNSNGTVATATAPHNGTNSTGYAYTNKQLTQITPVTGSSLGTRNYSYDTLGRLATATDGRAGSWPCRATIHAHAFAQAAAVARVSRRPGSPSALSRAASSFNSRNMVPSDAPPVGPKISTWAVIASMSDRQDAPRPTPPSRRPTPARSRSGTNPDRATTAARPLVRPVRSATSRGKTIPACATVPGPPTRTDRPCDHPAVGSCPARVAL